LLEEGLGKRLHPGCKVVDAAGGVHTKAAFMKASAKQYASAPKPQDGQGRAQSWLDRVTAKDLGGGAWLVTCDQFDALPGAPRAHTYRSCVLREDSAAPGGFAVQYVQATEVKA